MDHFGLSYFIGFIHQNLDTICRPSLFQHFTLGLFNSIQQSLPENPREEDKANSYH
jgi:hypothetical protein